MFEGEGEGVSLVCFVLLGVGEFPIFCINFREEGVCFFWRIVNYRQIKLFCQRKGLLIDACSSDNENFFLFGAGKQRCRQRRKDFRSRERDVAAAQHHIPPIGKSTLWEGLERLSSHDDGMPRRQCLEVLHIIRQMIDEPVVEPDGSVFGDCDNNAEGHEEGFGVREEE